MNHSRGVLYLADPMGGEEQMHMRNVQTLIFNENERYLYQAQKAFYQAQKRFDWICIAADGAADVALALAVQFMPDRIALRGDGKHEGVSLQLARLRAFARRNLALLACEVVLIGMDDGRMREIMRGIGHDKLYVVDDMPWRACHSLLTEPWNRLYEKNLLNPENCV